MLTQTATKITEERANKQIKEEIKEKKEEIKEIKEEIKEKKPAEKKEEKREFKFGIKIKEMLEKGVALGHRTTNLHPKMKDYVAGIKNTIYIIDLQKTARYLEEALNFISELTKQKKVLLLVGTKPPLKKLVEETAQNINLPYVTERWLGGTFTNFNVFSGRIKEYKQLEKEKQETGFSEFLKKERIKKEKKLAMFKKKFEGIKNLEELPFAVFICDIVKDKSALKEATRKNIKTIAIIDTNADPTLVDYPIPANDDAISAVGYILEKVKEAIKSGE